VGSLLGSYKGISGPPPGDTGWSKYAMSANTLGELKGSGTFDLSAVPSVTLGIGFDGQAVAGDIANFGTDGEDLTFEYTWPGSLPVRGQVVYEGTKFENNLVLRVNPDTGVATLKNDSHETLVFDRYEILSSTGDLDGIGWTGLGGTWEQSPASPTELSETNPLGSLTLEPGEEAAIGDISATGFTTEAAQDGLSMRFMLAESLVPSIPEGDYNGDGNVDAADYTVWRDGLETTYSDDDFDVWKANFGATGGGPETTFRIGSVVFDDTLAAGSGSLVASVPEPSTGLLLLAGCGAVGLALGASRKRTEIRRP